MHLAQPRKPSRNATQFQLVHLSSKKSQTILTMNIKNASKTLYHEFSSPLFDTIEPVFTSKPDTSRKTYRHRFSLEEIRASSPILSIEATFSPRPLWATLPFKFLLIGGAIAILVLDVLREASVWWMAYLENWGWSLVVAYFICSFGVAVRLARWHKDDAGLLVNTAWVLFAISLPSQVIIALMYFALQFDGSVEYLSIIKHGAAIPLLLIDGFVVNRIPLRMKQFGLFQLFVTGYLAWSIACAYSGLTMPSGQETMYEWLDWKADIHSAILLSLFVLVIVNPAVFVGCRAASRLLPRRLQNKSDKRDIIESSTADAQDEVDITHDIEEGDVSYDEKVHVILSDVTVNMPNEEEVSTPKTVATTHDEEIEDLASFPEIIYDDSDANMSLGSFNEDTEASSRGDIKKPYEDLESFPGDGNNTDYSFDKEGVDISFEREVSHASMDPDMVSFPDLLAP